MKSKKSKAGDFIIKFMVAMVIVGIVLTMLGATVGSMVMVYIGIPLFMVFVIILTVLSMREAKPHRNTIYD